MKKLLVNNEEISQSIHIMGWFMIFVNVKFNNNFYKTICISRINSDNKVHILNERGDTHPRDSTFIFDYHARITI